jgi:hypothetical protein
MRGKSLAEKWLNWRTASEGGPYRDAVYQFAAEPRIRMPKKER